MEEEFFKLVLVFVNVGEIFETNGIKINISNFNDVIVKLYTQRNRSAYSILIRNSWHSHFAVDSIMQSHVEFIKRHFYLMRHILNIKRYNYDKMHNNLRTARLQTVLTIFVSEEIFRVFPAGISETMKMVVPVRPADCRRCCQKLHKTLSSSGAYRPALCTSRTRVA
ncbi:hypothetical protein PUN28_002556 [Cardiocondyla obscurior]|uniref:Uncharacterized protein n=1 Tax=Cardiocondyla obscurior TaxID=286306 RepID=A0AAW2GUT7_9HYME